MKNSHFGYVEVTDIPSAIEFELTNIAISEFGCSGSQNAEIWTEELDNTQNIPAEILTMSGEFTEDQSDIVNELFFNSEKQTIKFFFEGELETITSNTARFVKFLQEELNLLGKINIEKNEDWRDSYRQFFTHAQVDSSLVVLPDWNRDNPDFEGFSKKLLLNPGMGFGTGGHETTRLCLQFLNKIEFSDEQVHILDLGCGSGVLGNYCEKYLSATVDYVDVDSDALRNCNENRTINGLSRNAKVVLRKDFNPNEYNLVIANILKPVLEMEMDLILNCLKPGGRVLLSGLLENQYEDLISFYKEKGKNKFSYELLKEGEWVALLIENIKRNE